MRVHLFIPIAVSANPKNLSLFTHGEFLFEILKDLISDDDDDPFPRLEMQ